MSAADPLLSLNLSVDYPGKPGVLRNLRLDVQRGEILGLVGESGCGKSTLAMAILGLLDPRGAKVRGEAIFEGRNLAALKESQMRAVRGREISLVFQSAMDSLNPCLRIGAQLREAWLAHRPKQPDDWRGNVEELFAQVRLPADPQFLQRLPSQLSVGQAQRVLIAMAMLHRPALLIADEPTSALDLITQAEVLRLFMAINAKFQTSILFITHDLRAVASICHRVGILHEGQLVELETPGKLFGAPRHPYAKHFVGSLMEAPVFT
ncbi:MAG: ABC transporter ATP-binding protein [Bryobacteraceae bacterium]